MSAPILTNDPSSWANALESASQKSIGQASSGHTYIAMKGGEVIQYATKQQMNDAGAKKMTLTQIKKYSEECLKKSNDPAISSKIIASFKNLTEASQQKISSIGKIRSILLAVFDSNDWNRIQTEQSNIPKYISELENTKAAHEKESNRIRLASTPFLPREYTVTHRIDVKRVPEMELKETFVSDSATRQQLFILQDLLLAAKDDKKFANLAATLFVKANQKTQGDFLLALIQADKDGLPPFKLLLSALEENYKLDRADRGRSRGLSSSEFEQESNLVRTLPAYVS